MNEYALSSDSPRWWWPSAVAGAASTAAIAAILVLPGAVQAAPDPVTPAEPAGGVFLGVLTDRPCFMVRARWNVALDGFQPRCPLVGTSVRAPERALRRGLDSRP